uniref:7-deoxyloganetin glucosyltransferase n=1 Tax=Vitis vinifera TaxID=29760 RepID=A5C2E4_VITVI|nr:hypothetical protein VITISV_029098 [Vitis vinifera]
MESVKKPHAVCLPLPAQGHMNPMLKIAKLLHSQGFYVTFVLTEFNYQLLVKSRGPNSLKVFDDFRFETISDGLPPTNQRGILDLPALCLSMPVYSLLSFRELILKLKASSDVPPITCIVSDDESCLSNGYLDTSIDWIPGLNGVRLKDLPTFIRTTDPNDTMFNYNLLSVNNALKAKSIILNTFEDLEKEVLDSIKTKFPPVYTIGPLWMLQQQLSEAKLDSIDLNLWKEDTRCLDWLDKRERGSVVYVNYGSLVTLTPSQLSEFAWGLANSKCPFLWVIRSNLVVSEAEIISKDFMEEISGRGLLSGWCPQEKVLQHPGDRQTNCFFSCGKWGLGVEIDSNVRREKVEGLVRELMGGEKGKEMKETAMQWKKRAEKATRSGGSSYVNFDNLVKQLKGKPLIETNTISPENVT